jgi:enoyl-CoA hydratase
VSSVRRGSVPTVILDRPEVRNAVNGPTADALHRPFVEPDSDDAVLASLPWRTAGTFGGGANVQTIGTEQITEPNGRYWTDGSSAAGDVQTGRRCL